MSEAVILLLVATVAFAYAMVGHGGASGYLALMGVLGFAPEVMRPTALVLNICVSLIAFVQFSAAGHFRWKLFWPFALASVPFAFIGGRIGLDPLWYKRVLALCIIVAALRLFGLFGQGQRALRNVPLGIALAVGALIGGLSGMLGIGGGILLSPVLLLFDWADAKEAAAVSALFIFVNSIAGLAGMSVQALHIDQNMLIWSGTAIAGGLLGSFIGARRAPEPRLRQALGAVLLLASIKLCWP
jgi:uncharacterized membrane protein YfcA